MPPRKTHKQYVDNCIEKNLDAPLESEDNRYINNITKLLHICKRGHPNYAQSPTRHLCGHGCPQCGIESARLKRTKTLAQYYKECEEKIIDLPIIREDNKYVDSNTPLIHTCKNGHPEYPQTPNVHLAGHGCPVCGIESRTSKRSKTHDRHHAECLERNFDLPVISEDNQYVNSNTALWYICRRCRIPYKHKPTNHLAGRGCKSCANKQLSIDRLKTHEQYYTQCEGLGLDLPIDAISNRYIDYSTKLLHKCSKGCPDYFQTPTVHLAGICCQKCAGARKAASRIKTHEEYHRECCQKDVDIPVDSEDNRYISCGYKLLHVCRKGHTPYSQTPSSHLYGRGCPRCGIETKTRTHEEYCKICFDRNLDPPLNTEANKYTHSSIKLLHICRNGHSPYLQTPESHLYRRGCPQCGMKSGTIQRTRTHEEYMKMCSDRNLDLPLDTVDNRYTCSRVKLLHVCKNGHLPYPQIPTNHLRGNGCPGCKHKTEGLLHAFLISLNFTVLREVRFQWTIDASGTHRYRRFDFYIPELNLLIELDGPHHFGMIEYLHIDHSQQLTIDTYEKMVPALRNGISVLRIPQPDFLSDRSGVIKETLKLALMQHVPTECVILTVANDLSIYDNHLELSELYYDNPDLLPDDTDVDSEQEDSDDDLE
jgi:very-short-patch-repair endonuclease